VTYVESVSAIPCAQGAEESTIKAFKKRHPLKTMKVAGVYVDGMILLLTVSWLVNRWETWMQLGDYAKAVILI